MNRRLFLCAVGLAPTLLQPAAALAADLPPTLDGLVLVKSKRLEAVYLLPGADFRVYAKVMLDPPEVAFRKDWMRDYNEQAAFSDQITDNDAQSIMVAVRKGFDAILTKAFTDAGYPVVTTPGKDVLRLRSAVLNLAVTAPSPEMSMNTIYSRYAGQATLVLEARDSVTGAILGRAEDAEVAGDSFVEMRNSVTNHQDFSRLGRRWADASVQGLASLKANSPFQPTANPAKP
jgi:Protein of unknown function (DUF3313)